MTWFPLKDGNDIIVTGLCTWFGGADDPEDSGETASGVSTKLNPDLLGCALPIPTCSATKGSPLPVLPYLRTFVSVLGPSGTIYVQLIDVGPAISTDHAIDLTRRAFVLAGGNLDTGVMTVTYRVLGAAHLL